MSYVIGRERRRRKKNEAKEDIEREREGYQRGSTLEVVE